jgi:hypothetical protein
MNKTHLKKFYQKEREIQNKEKKSGKFKRKKKFQNCLSGFEEKGNVRTNPIKHL